MERDREGDRKRMSRGLKEGGWEMEVDKLGRKERRRQKEREKI